MNVATDLSSAPSVSERELGSLYTFIGQHRTLVLSGAGISTESGIPDYRSPERLKRPRQPMRFQEFVKSHAARRRYWARSVMGWPHIERATPNEGHSAVARLESLQKITGILTQNVDGLHQKAGAQEVLELHGRLRTVICLNCGHSEKRERLQRRMLHQNPDFERFLSSPSAAPTIGVAPDGDADLSQSLIDTFSIPNCLRCSGVLKPDVVFFGENVPKARVERAWKMLAACDALLVVGSSLTVFSGYRFVARAKKEGKPVAIVNRGETRGDKDADLKLDAPLGTTLSALAKALT